MRKIISVLLVVIMLFGLLAVTSSAANIPTIKATANTDTVKVGDTVKASDVVIGLEAMKMENSIHAGRDGKVASVNVNVGDSVLEGNVLVTLE